MMVTPGSTLSEDADNLETSGGRVDLARIKDELKDVRSEAEMYFRRNAYAIDWWQSRWEGQTVDGRKWWKWDNDSDVFPWKGSSDTRVRLVKMLINEYRTIAMYALMNCKLQATSTRPTATPKEAAQATTLLNWQIFTHMPEEWHRETELAVVWSAGFGCSAMSVDWRQERRLDRVPLNMQQLGQFIGQKVGQQIDPMLLHDILTAPEHEKELKSFIQDLSPVVDKSTASSILSDLRKTGEATIPVPYIFINRPQIVALRPMIDVFFSPFACDLQPERWVDRVEYVTETVLRGREETDNYDPDFIEKACDLKGVYSTENSWAWDGNYGNTGIYGYNIIRPGNLPSTNQAKGGLIELHHFYHYSMDMGVPCLYRTVFHVELDMEAVSGPSEYMHGQMPFHSLRFETDHRPLLSSQGIPETCYNWENELKAQFDARTDRASISLSPPMFTPHSEMDKMAAFKPNARIPMRPGFRPEFAKVPDFDPGSTEVTQDIMARVDRYFGWFGNDVDPQLKQMRQMQVTDRIMTQFKPVVAQIGALDDQFLPDEDWIRVTGLPPRQNSRSRDEIQGQYEMTMTCDLRDLDAEYLLKKAQGLAQILPMDSQGQINRTPIIRALLEGWDYTLAEQALIDPGEASDKEIQDEMQADSLIIGSGVEQPLPPIGSNFQLRLQTMMNVANSTPFIKTRMAQSPDVTKAWENRQLYFQRQLQQSQNAIIGRTQVGQAYNKQAPPLMAPPAGQQGQQ